MDLVEREDWDAPSTNFEQGLIDPKGGEGIPYGWKFSRDPIFAEGPSSKILRSNFRGWTFQGCSTSYCTRAAAQKPAEKTASDRSILYLYLAELEIEKLHESSI